ncbi:MAG: ATP-binding cassette domain-containing protein [Bifidobacteriaceae bacterium]|nr:ATP-binding cassette domain-containing protein [Bifidobacteriaceae bacterium]
MAAGVEVVGLTHGFEDRVLFADLSWSVPGGSITAVMGPSGVGKSTLLALIAGHLTPWQGQIRTAGAVEWIVQSVPMLERRSALDNAAMGLIAQRVKWEEARQRAQTALENFALGASAATRVAELSGGERQRVAVVRSVLRGAPVLLADEPTASLDPATCESICDALVASARAGASVLVATHDPAVAARCEKVLDLSVCARA